MDKWLSQLMDNKKGINNKNVKQLLENDYLLIHCLSRWIDKRRRPLWEKKKMCWDVVDMTCYNELFLFNVITVILLLSLKPVFWIKSVFYVLSP